MGLTILKSFKEKQDLVTADALILVKTVSLVFCCAFKKESKDPKEYERLYEIAMEFQHWIRFDCLFVFFLCFF